MPDPPRHHLLATTSRVVALVVLGALVLPAVVVSGDLLVLPAVALVFLAWVVIALIGVAHWLVTVGAPPLVATVQRAAAGAWTAIADDPIGRHLHHWARRLDRVSRPVRSVVRWLRCRLSMAPTGLPLTLAVAVIAAGGAGLIWLGHGVDDTRSPLARFDLRVANVASRFQLTGERHLMEAITNVGATRTVLIILAVLVAGAITARAVRSAVLLTATMATSSALVTVLKATHARPRPALGQLVETSTSFPSGHAAASLSLALGIVLWCWAARLPRPSRVAAVVVPVALLIGYSRAYLSIHWLSDVAAGWIVAGVAAAIVFAGDRIIRRATPAARPRRPLALACAAGTVVAFFVGITGNHQFPTELPPEQPTHLASSDPATILATVPKYSETLLGRRMEPLGLVVVATDAELRAAIDKAGWTVADTLTPDRLLQTYWAGLTNQNDPTAPVTPTFLDTRVQDLAIQQQSLGQGVKARHHARLWQLPIVAPDGCPIWGVTASLDDRVEWTLRTLFPNHHIAPAIDTERDNLANALTSTSTLHDLGRYNLVGPTLGTNAAGDPFFTDGNVAVLQQTATCR